MRYVQLGKIVFAMLLTVPFFLGSASDVFAFGSGTNPPPEGFHRVGAAAVGTLTYSVTGDFTADLSFSGRCAGKDAEWGPIEFDADRVDFEAADGAAVAADLTGRVEVVDTLGACYPPSVIVGLVELTTVNQVIVKTDDTFMASVVILGLTQ